jgi:eukaryotic-like serine/threonine-protein kinase
MDEPVPGYVLHHRIGAGPTAEVFRAEPVGCPGRLVAVKRLRVVPPHGMLEVFRRDAEALAAGSNPHLLPILDVVAAGDRVALVTPHAVGGSLADRLADAGGGLPPVTVAELGAWLARALATVHEAGVLHRGIKPSNVLFDADGKPRVGDVGTARLTTGPGRRAVDGGYVDPAVLAGAPADLRSDLYSLGVTLHEALTGAPPSTDAPPAPTGFAADPRADVPLQSQDLRSTAPLRRVIERATARDRTSRHATARELADDLDEVRQHLEAERVEVPAPPRAAVHRAGVLGARSEATASAERPAPRAGRPAQRTGPAPELRRRHLVVLAALALAILLALPLGLTGWLSSGRQVPELPEEAPGATASLGEVGSAAEVDAARSTPPPACPDRPAPDIVGEVHLADAEGRGCRVPVVWDGHELHVPVDDGTVARYDLGAAPGDVLLLGDWSCDGHDSPALYRPDDGQLFVFEAFAEDTRARGEPTGVTGGRPVVVTDADGCPRIRIEATAPAPGTAP